MHLRFAIAGTSSLSLARDTAPKQRAIAIPTEIDPIEAKQHASAPDRLDLGPEEHSRAQDQQLFDEGHRAAMMLGIPVRNRADKTIVAERQKVTMSVVVMHGQVAQAM